jgi:soluble lytic murein transglycosylase-like protein
VVRLLVLTAAPFLIAPSLAAQEVRLQAERIRAAMEPSLTQQRASIRIQAQAALAGRSGMAWPAALPAAECEALTQPELTRMINEIAPRQNMNPLLIQEVVRQESGFYPCAVSSKGAAGLMQLMPATQAQFQVKNPFSPKESLEAGSKLLRDLLDRYHGNLSLALSAYNAGADRVDKAGAIPEIPETRNYVFSILHRMIQ